MVNLSWLSSRVPPKVHNACTRWVLNGFHTARRYQSQCPCLFCQSPGSSDCVEHFVECPLILHCIHPSVRYTRDLKNMFFVQATFALLVFAIYNTHTTTYGIMVHGLNLRSCCLELCMTATLPKRTVTCGIASLTLDRTM